VTTSGSLSTSNCGSSPRRNAASSSFAPLTGTAVKKRSCADTSTCAFPVANCVST
jgi:hypothetical protein